MGITTEGVCMIKKDCPDDRLALASEIRPCGFNNTGKICCLLPESGEENASRTYPNQIVLN